MAVFLEGVTRDEDIIAGPGGGTYVGGPFRGVLHTTQGGWNGSLGVFANDLTAPHVMAAPPSHPDGPRIVQFISLDRSAYALANADGGVETNRRGALQVEIVGFAEDIKQLTDDDLFWIGTKVVGPMTRAAPGPIKLEGPKFFGEEDGTLATVGSFQRMSASAWESFNGWCGHQHVPENDHWDPGKIDIQAIFDAASGEGFSILDRETKEYFDKKFATIRGKIKLVRDGQLNQAQRLRDVRESQGARADELAEIDADIGRIKASLGVDDDD